MEKLAASEAREKDLRDALDEMQGRLLLAETEVERLSAYLSGKKKGNVARVSTDQRKEERLQTRGMLRPSTSKPEKKSDVAIATVRVKKANLRAGPSKAHSPLMTVSRGTRLLVETRVGEWYRVIAPNGNRVWVSSEVVAFGKKPSASPSRTVEVKGYNASVEEEAFRLISNSGS